MEESQEYLEQRCRLCLLPAEEWDVTGEMFLNVFEQDESLVTKIRDCVGVQMVPTDEARLVCRNCELTVQLIDEFRLLCQQANQALGTACVRPKRGTHWESYRNHVGELYQLVREQRCHAFGEEDQQPGEMVLVKEEPIVGEWVEMEGSAEVKDECADLWEEDYRGDDSEDPGDNEDENIAAKLHIAREIAAHSSSNRKKKPQWKTIGEKVNLRALEAQQLWDEMKQNHKDRRKVRSANDDHEGEQGALYAMMDDIFPEVAATVPEVDVPIKTEPGQKAVQQRKPKAAFKENRLLMATAFHENPILWDMKHKHFQTPSERELVFEQLANQLSFTKKELKQEFKRLQDLYRSRLKRAHEGCQPMKLQPEDRQLVELLEKMFTGGSGGQRKQIFERRRKTTELSDKLNIANRILEHEVIWNKRHPDFSVLTTRDAAFATVGAQLELSLTQVKQQWKLLRDLFRGRYLRLIAGHIEADHPSLQEELYLLLEKMLKDTTEVGKRSKKLLNQDDTAKEEDGEVAVDRMQLAQVIRENEIIWNRQHDSFNDMPMRDRTFEKIASELGIPNDKIKAHWKALRDTYRSRSSRLMKGIIDKDHPSLQDPLYLLLSTMLADNMTVGKRSNAWAERVEISRTEFTNTDRIKLAQAIYDSTIIWNRHDSEYKDVTSLETAWQELADQFSSSVSDLKYQWKCLNDNFRVKHKRVLAKTISQDHPSLECPLYKLMVIMRGKRVKEDEEDPTIQGGNVDDQDLSRLTLAQKISEQELIWNKSHPDYGDHAKREMIWESLESELNVPVADLKQQWKGLRDVFRHRYRRFALGKINSNHTTLNDALYQLLEKMLMDNIEFSAEWAKRDVDVDGTENPAGPSRDTSRPFEDPELRERLADEISKNDILWNLNHPNYHRSTARGQAWASIAQAFGVATHHAKAEWSKVIHRARRIVESRGSLSAGLVAKDPLFRLLDERIYRNMVTIPGTSKRTAPGGNEPAIWPPKRRYAGKRKYSDEGCVTVFDDGQIRHKKVCELCGKHVERSEFEYHMNIHNGLKPYVCSFEGCDKKFSSRIAKGRHEVLVHSEGGHQFECDQCGEKFKYRSKFDYHYAINHKSEEIPCLVCGKLQKHKVALQNHMRIHAQHHECNVCGKVVQKKHSLDVHMRIHTQEKPFECELCGQRFRIKVLLKTHLSKVHGVLMEELSAAQTETGGLY